MRDGPFKNPLPRSWAGDFFFRCLRQLRLDGQRGSPRVTLPGYTTSGPSGSYAVFSNVWHMRSLRLQMKIDNLLDADYEQVLGFSQPGIRVRGGVTVNF